MIRGRERQWGFGMLSVAVGVAFTLVSWVFPLGAEAQEEQKEQVVELNLGTDLTIPGGDSYLPLMFFDRGVLVGKVVSEIGFPKNVLSFVEAKRGEAGDQAGAEVKTEVKDDSKNSKLSVLQVVISAGKELPGGVLATLKFQVSKSAPEGALKLKNVVKAMTPAGEEIKTAKGNETELIISPPKLPTVGCFFFTH